MHTNKEKKMELTTQNQTNQGGGMMQVASSREAQSVQAAMVVAQRFPRDTTRSFTRIIDDCKRKTLAMKAVYSYPRGGQTISGPSIRLAESMARAWGNLDFGIIELERKPSVGKVPGESVIMSYCYDLETNTKSSKVFTVRHARDKNVTINNVKTKIQDVLTDERDIYEMVANQGARRLRACILSIIPVDIVESAVEQCEKTMEGGQGPLIDRARQVVVMFKAYGVTQDMIETRLQHKIDSISETELVGLYKIGNSLKEGFQKREDFFELPKLDNQSQDAVPEAAPKAAGKAKSIKNFAPGAEAPKQIEPEDESQEAMFQEPELTRDQAIKAVLDKQKEIKMSAKDLASFTETFFKKKTNDLTVDELVSLLKELEGMKS